MISGLEKLKQLLHGFKAQKSGKLQSITNSILGASTMATTKRNSALELLKKMLHKSEDYEIDEGRGSPLEEEKTNRNQQKDRAKEKYSMEIENLEVQSQVSTFKSERTQLKNQNLKEEIDVNLFAGGSRKRARFQDAKEENTAEDPDFDSFRMSRSKRRSQNPSEYELMEQSPSSTTMVENSGFKMKLDPAKLEQLKKLTSNPAGLSVQQSKPEDSDLRSPRQFGTRRINSIIEEVNEEVVEPEDAPFSRSRGGKIDLNAISKFSGSRQNSSLLADDIDESKRAQDSQSPSHFINNFASRESFDSPQQRGQFKEDLKFIDINPQSSSTIFENAPGSSERSLKKSATMQIENQPQQTREILPFKSSKVKDNLEKKFEKFEQFLATRTRKSSRKTKLTVAIDLGQEEEPEERLVMSDSEAQKRLKIHKKYAENMSGTVGVKDFDFIAPLGKGGFGSVWLVRRKATNDIYALKVMKFHNKDPNFIESMVNENRIMMSLVGDYVVKGIFSFIHNRYYCVVMDLMVGGDFRKLLDENNAFYEEDAKFYAAELALAVDHIHKQKITHRDLKPENMLLDNKGHMKLADFGLSNKAETRQSVRPESHKVAI